MPTASNALLAALAEAGVSYLFANFGSDHPALMEALADARATGRQGPRPGADPVAPGGVIGELVVLGRATAVRWAGPAGHRADPQAAGQGQ